jgi:hypothetical protein
LVKLRLPKEPTLLHVGDLSGGVKPTSDDNMIFTSLRYYPF